MLLHTYLIHKWCVQDISGSVCWPNGKIWKWLRYLNDIISSHSSFSSSSNKLWRTNQILLEKEESWVYVLWKKSGKNIADHLLSAIVSTVCMTHLTNPNRKYSADNASKYSRFHLSLTCSWKMTDNMLLLPSLHTSIYWSVLSLYSQIFPQFVVAAKFKRKKNIFINL